MKKIVSIVAICALLLYALLSSFGVVNNFWGWDVSQTGWGWKAITVICLIVVGIIVRKYAMGRIDLNGGAWALLMGLLVLGFGASTGFKFTAGDIKQRITCFQNADGSPSLDGKVNPDCLKEYYNDFYHFDTKPDLWEYVVKYRELPGVNHWAFNIREGKTPPSTAPRAWESFEYHTGAYEQ